MILLTYKIIKGFDGEGSVYVLSESRRQVKADERQAFVVAPEPKGRKCYAAQVEPFRDCCVNA